MSHPTNDTPDIATLIGRSPGAQPREQALASVKARRANLLRQASLGEPDFSTPEPLPILGAPHVYAREFWQSRGVQPTAPPDPPPPTPKPPSKRRPGRPPLGDLSPRHDKFRVIDGDKQS